MLRHADSSQFTESTDQIQLPTFDSEVVSFVLGISKTKPRDAISVDLFCQQYLIEERVRQKIQRSFFCFFLYPLTFDQRTLAHCGKWSARERTNSNPRLGKYKRGAAFTMAVESGRTAC